MAGDLVTPLILLPAMWGAGVGGMLIFCAVRKQEDRSAFLKRTAIRTGVLTLKIVATVAVAEFLLRLVGGYVLEIVLFFGGGAAVFVLLSTCLGSAFLWWLSIHPELESKIVKWWLTNPNEPRE